jgi:hypothetical protein
MKYQCTILNSEKEFIDHEKGIYESFHGRNPDHWVNYLYENIDNCRFKSQIPYKDQIVYSVKEGEMMLAAGAVNTNTNRKMQLEEIGFSLTDEMKKVKCCEALLLWNKKSEYNPFKLLMDLREFIKVDLCKRGYKICYGACEDNRIKLFSTFSFKTLKKIQVNGKNRYLISLEI